MKSSHHHNTSRKFLLPRDNKQALASKKRQFDMWRCLSDVTCECLSKAALADNDLQSHCGLNASLLLLTNLLKSVSYRPSEDIGGIQLQALSHHAELLLSYWERHKKFPDTVIMCLERCLRLNHVLVHKRLKRIMFLCFSHSVPAPLASSLIQSIVSTYTRLRQLTHLIPIYCSSLEEATTRCGFFSVYFCRSCCDGENEEEKMMTELLFHHIVLSWKDAFSSTPEPLVIKIWGLLSEAVCKDYCEDLASRSKMPFKQAIDGSICSSVAAALGLLRVLTTSIRLSSRIADKMYDLAEKLVANNLGPALLETISVLQESSRKRKRRSVCEDNMDRDVTLMIGFIEVCCQGLSLYVSLLSFIERCKVWMVSDDRTKTFDAPTPLPLLKYIQLANSSLENATRRCIFQNDRRDSSTRKDEIRHLNIIRCTLQEVSLRGAFVNQNDARDLIKLSYALNDGEKSWAHNTWEISAPTVAQWAPLADEKHVNSFIDSLVIGAAKEMQQQQQQQQQCRNNPELLFFSFEASRHLALLSDAGSFEISNFSCHILPRIIFKAEELIRNDYYLNWNTVCCLWMIAEQLPVSCCENKGSFLTLWGILLSLEDTVAAAEVERAAEKAAQTAAVYIHRCIWKLCTKLSTLVEGEVREEDGMLRSAENHLKRVVHRTEHAKYTEVLVVVCVGLVESLGSVCLASKSTHGPEIVFQLLSDSLSRLKNLKATTAQEVDGLSLHGGTPSVAVEGLTKAIAKSTSIHSDSDEDTEHLGGLAKKALHRLVKMQKSLVALGSNLSLTGAIFRLAGSVSNYAKTMDGWSEWVHYQLDKYFPLDSSISSRRIKLDDRDTLDLWCTLYCDVCVSFSALPSGMEYFQRIAGCCISFHSSFEFSPSCDECLYWLASLPPPLQMGFSKMVASGEEADLRWLFSELCSRLLSSPLPSLVLLQCVGLVLRAGTGDGFNSVMMDFNPQLALYLSRVANDYCHSISLRGISHHHLDNNNKTVTSSSSGTRLSLLSLESLLTRGQCTGIGPQHVSCIMGSLAAIAATTRCNPDVARMADWCAPCASTASALVQFCHRRVLSYLPVLTSLCSDLIHFCLSDKCDNGGRNAVNRLLSGLAEYKSITRRYALPLLVTYVQSLLDGTNVSPLEHRMIAFTLLDICTHVDVEMVPKWLHPEEVDVFQNLYKDYLNKHKYTGSV